MGRSTLPPSLRRSIRNSKKAKKRQSILTVRKSFKHKIPKKDCDKISEIIRAEVSPPKTEELIESVLQGSKELQIIQVSPRQASVGYRNVSIGSMPHDATTSCSHEPELGSLEPELGSLEPELGSLEPELGSLEDMPQELMTQWPQLDYLSLEDMPQELMTQWQQLNYLSLEDMPQELMTQWLYDPQLDYLSLEDSRF
ncbi:2668_t:CDS:2 [Scutellospora calospora]|uniref:2668_t:CDS:1 n=1 Tax=Scutellospora calospora TaxID=85575 RepID=A0ACA9LZ56_9GLOM|nr:2668_t:CDS:2 [Scutellospora calospora]